jgi:glyoxylase-like metal-dependent hydrolase (beta-lactamase superfamily II)
MASDSESTEKLIFSGDHLFKGSIGRTDLPGGSYQSLVDSMKSKILPLDDGIIDLPGHGGFTTIGQERQTNPFILQMLP